MICVTFKEGKTTFCTKILQNIFLTSAEQNVMQLLVLYHVSCKFLP